jgi:hypothetical protein
VTKLSENQRLTGAHTRKPTDEEQRRVVEETAAQAVNTVNPGQPASSHEAKVAAEESVEIQIDPQMLAQATQRKNANLIAMMVHENAMFEVALEQERRARQEAEAKYEALKASLRD